MQRTKKIKATTVALLFTAMSLALASSCEGEGTDDVGEQAQLSRVADALVAAVDARCSPVLTQSSAGLDAVYARLEPSFPAGDLRSDYLALMNARLDDPSAVVDVDNVEACIAELQACAADFDYGGVCAHVVVGTAAVGEGCATDYSCAADAFCAGVADDGGCGVCEALGVVGGACDSARRCVSGASCSNDDVCLTNLADGERCDPDEGAHCASRRCIGEDGAEICGSSDAAVLAPGAACTDSCGGFSSGLACIDDVCVAIVAAALGERCQDYSVPGLIEHCVDSVFGDNACADLDDDGNGTCVRRPSSGACLVGVISALPCADDFACDDDDQCVPGPTVGEACIDSGCGAGHFCDFDTDVCAALGGERAACVSTRACAAGLTCLESACVVDDGTVVPLPVCSG